MNINVEAKRAVAQKAAEFVSNGDSLLIDTGTTTFEFVNTLYDKRNITIVTSVYPLPPLLTRTFLMPMSCCLAVLFVRIIAT